jgi:hypothetical protein
VSEVRAESEAVTVIFAPVTEVRLVYVCGCTEIWRVHLVPLGEPVEWQSVGHCPTDCWACRDGGKRCG